MNKFRGMAQLLDKKDPNQNAKCSPKSNWTKLVLGMNIFL
jgi:hypothetical protein